MRIGETAISKSGSVGKIVSYRNARDIDILIDGKYKRCGIQYGNFIRGRFGSSEQPKICGVGYIGVGSYKSKDGNGKHTDAYRKWHDMIERCYNPNSLKKRPTYEGVYVCDEWLNYQNFAKWYYENIVPINEEMHLDKDILSNEQKIYSPESCCLIPKSINLLFKRTPKTKDTSKSLPVGVQKQKRCINKYKASLYKNGKTIVKSGFDSPEAAFIWYKSEKEKHIREVAMVYKDVLPRRVYDALTNYDIKPYPYKEEQ